MCRHCGTCRTARPAAARSGRGGRRHSVGEPQPALAPRPNCVPFENHRVVAIRQPWGSLDDTTPRVHGRSPVRLSLPEREHLAIALPAHASQNPANQNNRSQSGWTDRSCVRTQHCQRQMPVLPRGLAGWWLANFQHPQEKLPAPARCRPKPTRYHSLRDRLRREPRPHRGAHRCRLPPQRSLSRRGGPHGRLQASSCRSAR